MMVIPSKREMELSKKLHNDKTLSEAQKNEIKKELLQIGEKQKSQSPFAM